MKKQVMVRAWEIVREAVKNFGGKATNYLSGALSIAWKELKNKTIETVKKDSMLIEFGM